jgi:hypothetical protein
MPYTITVWTLAGAQNNSFERKYASKLLDTCSLDLPNVEKSFALH